MATPRGKGQQRTPLTSRMTLVSPAGQPVNGQVDGASGDVLGSDGTSVGGPILTLSEFRPVEPPVVLQEPPADRTILGAAPDAPASEEIAAIEFVPEEDAAYLLLHEIETADGMIYEVSLPEGAAEADGAVLGGSGGPGTLRFPVHRLVRGQADGTVLGSPFEAVGGFVRDQIFRRVVHMLRAPVSSALQGLIAEREGPPAMVVVAPDATLLGPLNGAEAWRGRFSPEREHRVLIFFHGFTSNVRASLPRTWVRNIAERYDAILGFNHPTLSADPLQNARDLLAQIPDDLRLNADLVAHSRGGLVPRALVELLPPTPKLNVQRFLSCGAPHAGTGIVDPKRWDQLASILLTTSSWLLRTTGVAPLAIVTQLLEYLLRAGSQFFFDLPGANAMAPNSAFLNQLNAGNMRHAVPYAVLTSAFEPERIEQASFRDALTAMAARAFLGEPNDLVVPTDSMSAIDPPFSPQLAGWIARLNTNHHGYFDDPEGLRFARQFLFGEWE
jgi:hypothetical protein